MFKKWYIVLIGALVLFLGLSTTQAAVGEMNEAHVYYTYYLEEDSNFWGGEIWEKSMKDQGTIAVESLSDSSANYAVSEIRYSDVDYMKGAGVEAAFKNSAYPEAVSGGYGGSVAEAYVEIIKAFEVKQGGEASVTFSLEGSLSSSGMLSEAGYELDAWSTYGDSNTVYQDYWVNNGDNRDVSESFSFLYDFDAGVVGDSVYVNLGLYIWAVVGEAVYDGELEYYYPDGSVDGYAAANFLDSLSIDSISGGIVAIENQVLTGTVPVPGTGILLVSGLIGLAFFRRGRTV